MRLYKRIILMLIGFSAIGLLTLYALQQDTVRISGDGNERVKDILSQEIIIAEDMADLTDLAKVLNDVGIGYSLHPSDEKFVINPKTIKLRELLIKYCELTNSTVEVYAGVVYVYPKGMKLIKIK